MGLCLARVPWSLRQLQLQCVSQCI